MNDNDIEGKKFRGKIFVQKPKSWIFMATQAVSPLASANLASLNEWSERKRTSRSLNEFFSLYMLAEVFVWQRLFVKFPAKILMNNIVCGNQQ